MAGCMHTCYILADSPDWDSKSGRGRLRMLTWSGPPVDALSPKVVWAVEELPAINRALFNLFICSSIIHSLTQSIHLFIRSCGRSFVRSSIQFMIDVLVEHCSSDSLSKSQGRNSSQARTMHVACLITDNKWWQTMKSGSKMCIAEIESPTLGYLHDG